MNEKYRAWATPGLLDPQADLGLGTVAILRRKGFGEIEGGFFFVDRYCLGVRDARYDIFPEADLEETLQRLFVPERQELDPASVRKFVESAVAYAKKLGFAPPADYKKATRVFGGIRAEDCPESFSFGRNGKPCFMPLSSDDPEKNQRILARLSARLGPEGFTYVDPMGSLDELSGDPQFFAEQTGGGPLCRELEEMIGQLHKQYEALDDVSYDEEENPLAGILQPMMESLEEVLAEKGSSSQENEASDRDLSLAVVMTALNLWLLDPTEREKVQAELGLDEGLKQFLAEIWNDAGTSSVLTDLVQPDPHVVRYFHEARWGHEPSPGGGPRLLLIYSETYTAEDAPEG
jgi:hypothetical protein